MMKKVILLFSCLMVLASPIYAAEDFKLEAEVLGTRLLSEWDDQISEENVWFVVDMQLTNWHVDEQYISDLLSGELVFKDAYVFDAVPEFDSEIINPLAEKKGELVFEIPKMISRSFDANNVQVFVTVDGEEAEIDLETEPSVTASSIEHTGTLEGSGYDTPEDAVLAYLNGLSNGDASEMLSTFAIESYVEHQDPVSTLKRRKAFVPASRDGIPHDTEYAKSLVINARLGELVQYILYQYIELSTNAEGQIIALNEDYSLDDLLYQFKYSPVNEWIGNVEFIEWINPANLSANFFTANNLSNIAVNAACAGADDFAELAAYIRLNGEDAIQLMECVKYNGRWYNLTLLSNLANILGLNAYSGGLLYSEEYSVLDDMEDTDYEAYDEMLGHISSWENSDLIGTHWTLEDIDMPGYSINLASSAQDASNAADLSMYADLRFMHLGCAVLDIEMSPLLSSEVDSDNGNLKTVAVWTANGETPVFEKSNGIGEDGVGLEYSDCIRNGDTLTIVFGSDEGSLTFRRTQD